MLSQESKVIIGSAIGIGTILAVLLTLMIYFHADTAARIDRLDGRMDGLTVQVARMDERLKQVEVDITDIKRRVGTLETDVADIKRRVGTLETDVADIKRRVGTLETDVADIKRHIGVLADAPPVSDAPTVGQVATRESAVTPPTT